MIKIKHLGLLALASTTFLFSGCVYVEDTFPEQDKYYNDSARVNLSLVSYDYPYYYDRPFYYLAGIYYYGGFYCNGFYHYGDRRFRHGHYYSHGHRYYKGRRYRAHNGRYGYYKSRNAFEHLHGYRKMPRRRDLNRGREYRSRKYSKNSYYKRAHHNSLHQHRNNNIRERVRQRPER